LEHRGFGPMPDFRMAILGDIPSPEEDEPAMVRIQYANTTSQTATTNATFEWDLGDGQSSEVENPGHIYLLPKYYLVKMTIRRGAKARTIANRVQVIRSIIVEKEENTDKLASYIELLEKYNALNLDPKGLVQLVRAYLRIEQWDKAVTAGKMAFAGESPSHNDASRWALIKLIGPLMRNKLGDAKGAAETNRAASSLIGQRDWSVACAIEAADTFLNDLLMPSEAKPLLDFATGRSQGLPPQMVSRLHRVWGDYHARTGDGPLGRSAYAKAKSARRLNLNAIKQITQRGAYSRSSEAFLCQNELERLRDELNKWQNDFPLDKSEGFMSVILAGYWVQQDKFPQAIAVANDLLAVRPNSPFADRLLYLAALCEGKLKHKDRAAAALQSLLDEYPGSHLVDRVKEQLERLASGSDLLYDDLYPPQADKKDDNQKQEAKAK
jgi:tetratricopeptide (TPR) repeat protein